MQQPAGLTKSQVPLQEPVTGRGDLESGREPGPQRNCRECHYKKWIIGLGVVFSALIIIIIVLAAHLSSAALCPPAVYMCPDGWIGYQRKCHYFSETEGNWTYSRNHCSSRGASLAEIDSGLEMTFLLHHKGVHDHWIGLKRETGQPWKWTSGIALNPLFWVRGEGDCAYLNDENGVSSSRCYTERQWICSKLAVYVTGKELHRNQT